MEPKTAMEFFSWLFFYYERSNLWLSKVSISRQKISLPGQIMPDSVHPPSNKLAALEPI
jgi:hypothetical protein